MADPVNQDIIDEIVSRLGNITTGNGYEFTAGTVAVGDRDVDEFRPTPKCIFVEQEQEIPNNDWFCPGNPPRVAFDLPVLIHGFSDRVDRDESVSNVTDVSTTENQMAAAIRKAIVNNDAGGWHLFDGKAKTARLETFAKFNEPGWSGATVMVTVTYRVQETDPFTVG